MHIEYGRLATELVVMISKSSEEDQLLSMLTSDEKVVEAIGAQLDVLPAGFLHRVLSAARHGRAGIVEGLLRGYAGSRLSEYLTDLSMVDDTWADIVGDRRLLAVLCEPSIRGALQHLLPIALWRRLLDGGEPWRIHSVCSVMTEATVRRIFEADAKHCASILTPECISHLPGIPYFGPGVLGGSAFERRLLPISREAASSLSKEQVRRFGRGLPDAIVRYAGLPIHFLSEEGLAGVSGEGFSSYLMGPLACALGARWLFLPPDIMKECAKSAENGGWSFSDVVGAIKEEDRRYLPATVVRDIAVVPGAVERLFNKERKSPSGGRKARRDDGTTSNDDGKASDDGKALDDGVTPDGRAPGSFFLQNRYNFDGERLSLNGESFHQIKDPLLIEAALTGGHELADDVLSWADASFVERLRLYKGGQYYEGIDAIEAIQASNDGAIVRLLSSQCHPRHHACTLIRDREHFYSISKVRAHLSTSCAAAMHNAGVAFTHEDYQAFPPLVETLSYDEAVSSAFPPDAWRSMARDTLRSLVGGNFCESVTWEVFESLPLSSLAAVSVECFMALRRFWGQLLPQHTRHMSDAIFSHVSAGDWASASFTMGHLNALQLAYLSKECMGAADCASPGRDREGGPVFAILSPLDMSLLGRDASFLSAAQLDKLSTAAFMAICPLAVLRPPVLAAMRRPPLPASCRHLFSVEQQGVLSFA